MDHVVNKYPMDKKLLLLLYNDHFIDALWLDYYIKSHNTLYINMYNLYIPMQLLVVLLTLKMMRSWTKFCGIDTCM